MYGLSYPLDAYFMSAWAHAFGGYYFDESNVELGLSNEATLEGFQFILDNLRPYSPTTRTTNRRLRRSPRGTPPSRSTDRGIWRR